LAWTQSSDKSTSKHNHIGKHPNTGKQNLITEGEGKREGEGLLNYYRWKRSGRRGPDSSDGREDGAIPGRGGDGRAAWNRQW
jgi:hypothetical protein